MFPLSASPVLPSTAEIVLYDRTTDISGSIATPRWSFIHTETTPNTPCLRYTIVKPKRSTAGQPSGSKYLDNLEKEAAVRLAAKNAKKKKSSTADNTAGSNNENPSRNSTQSQPYALSQSQTSHTSVTLDPLPGLQTGHLDSDNDNDNDELVDRSQKPEDYALNASDSDSEGEAEGDRDDGAMEDVTETQPNSMQKSVKRKAFL